MSKNDADEAVSVVSLTSSSGGYINGRNSANLELLIDKTSSINRASLLHNLKSNALVQTQQGFLAKSMLIYDIFICCSCNISYVQGFLE
jgi:hypothetical protein